MTNYYKLVLRSRAVIEGCIVELNPSGQRPRNTTALKTYFTVSSILPHCTGPIGKPRLMQTTN